MPVREILTESGYQCLSAPVDITHYQDLGLSLIQVCLIDTDGICLQVFVPLHVLIGILDVLEYIG